MWDEYRNIALYTVSPSITFGFCLIILIFEIWYRCKEGNSKMVLMNPAVNEKRMEAFTFHEIDERVEKG